MHAYTPNRPTIFESVVVLTWLCLARAQTTADIDTASEMSTAFLAINIRRRLVPLLPIDYFGNAATGVFGRLPLSTLLSAESATATTIETIQTVLKEDTTDLNLRLISKLVSRKLQSGVQIPANLLGHDIFFNSWEHLYPNLDDMDLGVGDFCTMRWVMDSLVPSYALILPSYGKRQKPSGQAHPYEYPGGIELNLSLLQYQMEKLEVDKEWSRYACAL